MAYLDEEDEDRIRDLADDPETIGEAMERSRRRAALAGVPEIAETPEEAPAADPLAGLDLSALDSRLEDNARGVATPSVPATPEDGAHDSGPLDPVDSWSAAGNDEDRGRPPAEPAPGSELSDDAIAAYLATADVPPDDPDAPPEFADLPETDLGTLGAAMDYNSSAPAATPPPGRVAPHPAAPGWTIPAAAAHRPLLDVGMLSGPVDEPDDYPDLDDLGRVETTSTPLASSGPEGEPGEAKVPSETTGPPTPDFTGADWSDAVRRPLHAILSGLARAGGATGLTPFHSERAAMEERLRARDAAKGAATTAFEARSARAADRAADRASRESIAEERARLAAEREDRMAEEGRAREAREGRRTDISDRRAGAYETDVGSRVASRTAETARTTERGDPSSGASTRARERLAVLVNSLPERIREDVRAGVADREWSAEEIERLERAGPQWWRPFLSRAGGGAGGTGGLSALRAEAVRLGIPEETAAVMNARGLRDALDEMSGREAGGTGAEGDILVPGVPMSAVRAPMSTTERARVHESFRAYRNASEAMRHIEEVVAENGHRAEVDPEIWGDVETDLSVLTDMVGRIRNIGVIQIGEMASVRAALPDPTNITGRALGRFAGALRGWRRTSDHAARTTISQYTDDNEEAVDAAMAWVHGGRSSGGGSTRTSGPVRVRGTDGVVLELTPEEWETVRDAGLDEEFEVVR